MTLLFALGIEAKILFCPARQKRLKRIARPEGKRPNNFLKPLVSNGRTPEKTSLANYLSKVCERLRFCSFC